MFPATKLETIHLQNIRIKSGFSSKTIFFITFKKETGLTPTEFTQQKQPTN